MVEKALHLVRGFFGYLLELLRSRRLILDLTRREFRGRYLGSMFGLVWAFIHPAIMMLIYWVVFRTMRAGDIDGTKYVVWLLSGLIPWFFINEAIAGGSMSVLDNRFLVKKVVFRVSLLPVVRLLTVVPVHLFFLGVIILIAWGYGTPPSIYYLQIPYFMAATLIISLGIALLTSALVPFFRDLSQIVMVILQIAFWMLPIVWQPAIPAKYQWIVMIDPFYYIIRGYRESLIEHTWFWTQIPATLYFWTMATLAVVVGGIVFHRLKPHFADVI